MAGYLGNNAWWGLAKQSVKGTVVTPPVRALPFSGGNLGPSRQIDVLSETDAQRDLGVNYVQVTGAEGAPEAYVRDASVHTLLEGVLGTAAHSGATNYTHTITPASTIPYYTFYRAVGGALWEQLADCMISEVTFSTDAGSPLTAAWTIVGRSSVRLAADPSAGLTTPTLDSGTVYNYNDCTVTLAGGATSVIGSFEATITNNVTAQQTDESVPYDVTPGGREVSLGFTLIFDSLNEYNRFHTGTTSGTTQASTIATTDASFSFSKGVNNAVNFTFPNIAYEEFPVAPDPAGGPITVDVRARAQRGGSPVVTAVVKNQIAT